MPTKNNITSNEVAPEETKDVTDASASRLSALAQSPTLIRPRGRTTFYAPRAAVRTSVAPRAQPEREEEVPTERRQRVFFAEDFASSKAHEEESEHMVKRDFHEHQEDLQPRSLDWSINERGRSSTRRRRIAESEFEEPVSRSMSTLSLSKSSHTRTPSSDRSTSIVRRKVISRQASEPASTYVSFTEEEAFQKEKEERNKQLWKKGEEEKISAFLRTLDRRDAKLLRRGTLFVPEQGNLVLTFANSNNALIIASIPSPELFPVTLEKDFFWHVCGSLFPPIETALKTYGIVQVIDNAIEKLQKKSIVPMIRGELGEQEKGNWLIVAELIPGIKSLVSGSTTRDFIPRGSIANVFAQISESSGEEGERRTQTSFKINDESGGLVISDYDMYFLADKFGEITASIRKAIKKFAAKEAKRQEEQEKKLRH